MPTESKKLQTYLREISEDCNTLADHAATWTPEQVQTQAFAIQSKSYDSSRIAHEQREVIRKARELVGFILSAAEDQVSINLELGQTHEERERRKVQLLGFIRGNLDQVIDRAEPFMAAAAPFFED